GERQLLRDLHPDGGEPAAARLAYDPNPLPRSRRAAQRDRCQDRGNEGAIAGAPSNGCDSGTGAAGRDQPAGGVGAWAAGASAERLAKDPGNRLLTRGPRYRLEAEMVRDQALSLAGLLSRKMHGPSVFPPQPDGLWQAGYNGDRTWPTSKGEDRYRRRLYTF